MLSNSLTSMALWGQSNMQIMVTFPSAVQDGLKGGYGDPQAYRAALEEVYKLHACRMDPLPKEVTAGGLDPIFGDRETGNGGDLTVSFAMWTIVDRLHEITVPCLVINGRYDLWQDFVVRPFVDKIPKVKWISYENASHLPMWEER
ncbi:hypothetical protein B0H10DRAFT_2369592, partial [Mycena sp. CBHHK59/15]